MWERCIADVERVQRELKASELDEASCQHILTAQCALLDEAVKGRGVEESPASMVPRKCPCRGMSYPQTHPVLAESPIGRGMGSLLASWPVRIGLSVVVVAALWWGLSHWLDQTLLTLLPGAVK